MFEYFQYLTERATSSNEDDPKDNFGDCDGDDGWVPLWERCDIVKVWNISRLQHLQLEKQQQVSVGKRLIRAQNPTKLHGVLMKNRRDGQYIVESSIHLETALGKQVGGRSNEDLVTRGKKELNGWSKVAKKFAWFVGNLDSYLEQNA